MKKFLLFAFALVAAVAVQAQDTPYYTVKTLATEYTEEGWEDETWFLPEDSITVEVYDGYVMLKGWAGVENYDLKVSYDADDNVTAIAYYFKGELKTEITEAGWSEWMYTGISGDDRAFRMYLGEGYDYAGDDPDDNSGYVLLTMLKADGATYQDYYIYWPLSEDDGIEAVNADSNAPVEYYNLQGIRVAEPAAGVFIKRQGNVATKVLVK